MTYPSFSVGETLRSADMNAVGMWLIKTQTISNGAASVTVTGAFSSDYDNYLITVSGGSTNGGDYGINMRLGSTTGGYYYTGTYLTYGNAASWIGAANDSSWGAVGIASTNNCMARVSVHSPFTTKNTFYSADYTYNNPGGGRANMAGYLADNNSYTAFTLFLNASSFAGGTIRVYGMRN